MCVKVLYMCIYCICCQGKYVQIQFSLGGQPDGGRISNFLLEKVQVKGSGGRGVGRGKGKGVGEGCGEGEGSGGRGGNRGGGDTSAVVLRSAPLTTHDHKLCWAISCRRRPSVPPYSLVW